MKPDYIGNIRTFRTANFTVSVDAFVDYDMDLSFDETGETREKLENGDYIGFYAVATVTHDKLGEVGNDSLGGCIYESLEAFEDHREAAAQMRRENAKRRRQHKRKVLIGSYFADMIGEAIKQARRNIAGARSIYVREG